MDMNDIIELVGKNPEAAVATAHVLIEQYKPFLYSLLNDVFGIYKDYANNEDVFATEAKARMNSMKALMDQGFTREEAFALIMNDRVALKEAMKNTGVKVNTKK